MRGSRLLFVASVVLLVLLSVTVIAGSLGSLYVAYSGGQDGLTATVSVEKIQEIGGEEASDAFRGRRATAATWSLGYAILSLLVVLVPYRRKERWAWWALLLSMGLGQLLSGARIVVLGTVVGTGTAGILLSLTLLGLLAGAPAVFGAKSEVQEI